jgi:membrane dipeptidase
MATTAAGDAFPWALDAHCDTWYMQEFLRCQHLPPEMRSIDPDAFFRVTLPRLAEGNVRCVFANVGDMSVLTSSRIIDNLYALANQDGSGLAICRDAAEIERTVGAGRLAIVPACEGAFLFLERLDLLRNWHRLGVRVVTLTHGEGQEGLGGFAEIALAQEPLVQCGSSCALQGTASRDGYLDPAERAGLQKTEKGLSAFGRSAVQEMARLGIVSDLSHANDATFWDLMGMQDAMPEGRFCCTHSNCAALCPHARNLTDEMMEALAGAGGVMGLCYFGEFIDEKQPSLERYIDHVLHAIDVMGEDHVGIGSDYDGVPPGAFMAVPHPGRTGELWQALGDAGLRQTVLAKIAHGNFLRLLLAA